MRTKHDAEHVEWSYGVHGAGNRKDEWVRESPARLWEGAGGAEQEGEE